MEPSKLTKLAKFALNHSHLSVSEIEYLQKRLDRDDWVDSDQIRIIEMIGVTD